MNQIKDIFYKAIICFLMAATWVSCKDEKDQLELKRMFKPATFTIAEGETQTTVAWRPSLFTLPGDVEYAVEVSKDATFSSAEVSKTTTDPGVILLDTEIDVKTDYYVRVKALGKDGADDSNWLISEPFQITGQVFILPAGEHDITTEAVKITWEPEDVLTKIVITPEGGTAFELTISASEAAAGEKIIDGLTANTNYTAEIFKGEVTKGAITFRTKDSYATSNVIDLRGITDKPNILADTLSDIPSGSVVLLKRGQTYTISSKDFDRSVTITSGPDFIAEFATIRSSNSFNLTLSSNIDSLVFKDLNLTGAEYGGDYVVNINRVGTIGTVRFENVRGHRFRGFFRLQTGSTGTKVENFFMNNCVVDSIRDFSLINSNNQNTVANIKVTNTTLYDARKVIDHRSPGLNSLSFENCTFNNLPTGGAAGGGTFYFIDLNTQNSTNPIAITNCIFGKSRNEDLGGDDVRGIRAGTSTSVVVTNSYKTSDFISTNVDNQIPGLVDYPGTSVELFADPVSGDFTIIDSAFPGATSAGDPRWR